MSPTRPALVTTCLGKAAPLGDSSSKGVWTTVVGEAVNRNGPAAPFGGLPNDRSIAPTPEKESRR